MASELVERFLKYVSFDTQSDENSTTSPSTDKQLLLGKYLEKTKIIKPWEILNSYKVLIKPRYFCAIV